MKSSKNRSKYISNIFVRFGGVNIKPQKGYQTDSEEKGFHNPPARRGFYAFPLKSQELFLLSGEFQGLDYESMLKLRKQFSVHDSDLIWHHLETDVRHCEIFDQNGCWIKTSVKTWKKAFSKQSLNLRWDSFLSSKETFKEQERIQKEEKLLFNKYVNSNLSSFWTFERFKSFHKFKSTPNYTFSWQEPIRSGLSGTFSKDHLEVFFEDKFTDRKNYSDLT